MRSKARWFRWRTRLRVRSAQRWTPGDRSRAQHPGRRASRRHVLAVGTQRRCLADVKVVTTHPHAEAQCRPWLAENLPHAQYTRCAFHGGGGSCRGGRRRPQTLRRISAPLAGQVYGLNELAANIAGSTAQTRFVLVTRPSPPPAATGADKTTAGALHGRRPSRCAA